MSEDNPTPKSEPLQPPQAKVKPNGNGVVSLDHPGNFEEEAAGSGSDALDTLDTMEFKPVIIDGGKDGSLPQDFDPFDNLDRIREKSAIGTTVPVTKNRLSIPVERPREHHFFRVHPNPEFTIEVTLLDCDRSLFYVDHELFEALTTMGLKPQPYRLYPYITRALDWGVWPVRVPGENGRDWSWWSTAHQVATIGRDSWLRVSANQGTNAYEYYKPEAKLADPVWPEMSLNEWLRLAFSKERRILSVDHFVIQQLSGRQ